MIINELPANAGSLFSPAAALQPGQVLAGERQDFAALLAAAPPAAASAAGALTTASSAITAGTVAGPTTGQLPVPTPEAIERSLADAAVQGLVASLTPDMPTTASEQPPLTAAATPEAPQATDMQLPATSRLVRFADSGKDIDSRDTAFDSESATARYSTEPDAVISGVQSGTAKAPGSGEDPVVFQPSATAVEASTTTLAARSLDQSARSVESGTVTQTGVSTPSAQRREPARLMGVALSTPPLSAGPSSVTSPQSSEAAAGAWNPPAQSGSSVARAPEQRQLTDAAAPEVTQAPDMQLPASAVESTTSSRAALPQQSAPIAAPQQSNDAAVDAGVPMPLQATVALGTPPLSAGPSSATSPQSSEAAAPEGAPGDGSAAAGQVTREQRDTAPAHGTPSSAVATGQPPLSADQQQVPASELPAVWSLGSQGPGIIPVVAQSLAAPATPAQHLQQAPAASVQQTAPASSKEVSAPESGAAQSTDSVPGLDELLTTVLQPGSPASDPAALPEASGYAEALALLDSTSLSAESIDLESPALNLAERLSRETAVLGGKSATEGWLKEIGLNISGMVQGKLGRMSLQLHPADLGVLEIEILTQDGVASVDFSAVQPATRELLDATLPRLRELLQQQGLQLGDAVVRDQAQQQARDQARSAFAAAQAAADSVANEAEPAPRAPRISRSALLDAYA